MFLGLDITTYLKSLTSCVHTPILYNCRLELDIDNLSLPGWSDIDLMLHTWSLVWDSTGS